MSQDRQRRENVFDAIKKPPSVAMEKIQNTTAATLDRMATLQQRYRQHREAMNSDSSDKSRRTSTTSTIDSHVSYLPPALDYLPLLIQICLFQKCIPLMNRPPLPPQSVNNNHNQWEPLSRTDSFSSVSNHPQCYPNQNQMNHQNHLIAQAQAQAQAQACGTSPVRRPIPMPGNAQNLPPRNMSASVFNLNQGGYPQPSFQQQNPWGINQMSQVRLYSFLFSTIN